MALVSLALVPLLAVAAARPDKGVVTAGDLQAVVLPLESGVVPEGAKLGKFDRRCRRQGVVPGVYVLDGWCRPWTPGVEAAGD
jgi:hypothetical protein